MLLLTPLEYALRLQHWCNRKRSCISGRWCYAIGLLCQMTGGKVRAPWSIHSRELSSISVRDKVLAMFPLRVLIIWWTKASCPSLWRRKAQKRQKRHAEHPIQTNSKVKSAEARVKRPCFLDIYRSNALDHAKAALQLFSFSFPYCSWAWNVFFCFSMFCLFLFCL